MKSVLLIGDVIIDRFTYGKKLGVSAETPTIVAEKEREETFLGGAGLVLRHLLSLGCHVSTIMPGPELIVNSADSELHEYLMDQDFKDLLPLSLRKEIFPGWIYTTKHRFFVDTYKMVQFDNRNKKVLSLDASLTIETIIEGQLKSSLFDSIVVSDNRHGSLNYTLARSIVDLSHKYHVPMYVDSQISQSSGNHDYYEGATNFLLNEIEFLNVCDMVERFSGSSIDGNIEIDLPKVQKFLSAKNVYLKLGSQGSFCYDGKQAKRVFADKVNVVDTCGAGDAFLAKLVATGGNLKKATEYATESVTWPGTSIPKDNGKK